MFFSSGNPERQTYLKQYWVLNFICCVFEVFEYSVISWKDMIIKNIKENKKKKKAEGLDY